MAEEVKSQNSRAPEKAAPGLFDVFACRKITYDLVFSPESIDMEAFYKAAHITEEERDRWKGVCAQKERSSGYHLHFNGRADQNKIQMSLQFAKGSIRKAPDEVEPFAETFMPWLAKFVPGATVHSTVFALFVKSGDHWRSRFNLPFRVTLSGLDAEVTIDGISLILPDNPIGARHGWLTKEEKDLAVNIKLERRINLKAFQLSEELSIVNEGIRMFAEEVAK